jgi:hypothetical protein
MVVAVSAVTFLDASGATSPVVLTGVLPDLEPLMNSRMSMLDSSLGLSES